MNTTSSSVSRDGRSAAPAAPLHHFTVDVEESFHASALEPWVARGDWDRLESRVEHGTHLILDLMADAAATGTFFTLGWVAERHAGLVRRIVAEGHELASHGDDHRRVTELDEAGFRDSVRRSKAILEDVAGVRVEGYRAPSFSIVPGLEWALDVLVEEGYRYDSSLNPIPRRGAGYPGAPPDPHWIERPAGRLLEVPVASLPFAGSRLPAGGGAWFRLLPYRLVQAGLRRCAARGEPGTFYIHPWEVDPDQPRLPIPWRTRIRHYGGLAGTVVKLRRLLSEFRFGPIADTLARRS